MWARENNNSHEWQSKACFCPNGHSIIVNIYHKHLNCLAVSVQHCQSFNKVKAMSELPMPGSVKTATCVVFANQNKIHVPFTGKYSHIY